jgi:membrane-associated phospholipid phosphatase
VLVLFALVTQLGDVWFLFLLGGVLYVAGDECRRGLFVLGLLLTYVALNGVLKQLFLLPRPPGAADPIVVPRLPALLQVVVDSISTADGPGFPSGHALGSSMVWGGFALVVVKDRLSRAWLGLAGTVVVTVSLSRLVLGVHYFVDVVVGAAVGAVVLATLSVVADRGTEPARVLLVAVGIGALGLIQGITFESVAAVGSAVGAWLVWRGVAESTPTHPTSRREVVAGFAVLGIAGGLFTVLEALEPAPLVTFVGAAVAVGGAVGAPLAGETLVD